MSESVRITGTKIVAVTKYSRFDPANPAATSFDNFSLSDPDESGQMSEFWAKEGYIQVGKAIVEIELMPQKEVAARAVTTLRKQKDAVIAAAQYEATQIERRIQSLLAITNEA